MRITLDSDKKKKFVMADFLAGLETVKDTTDEGFIWFPQFMWDSSTRFNSEIVNQLNDASEKSLNTVDYDNDR